MDRAERQFDAVMVEDRRARPEDALAASQVTLAGIADVAPDIGFALWPFFEDEDALERSLSDIVRLARRRPVMARVQISWADWARPYDGPRWLDHLINRLHDAGIAIFPTFMWTPPSFGLAPISSAPPRDPGTFVWFVRHVLERYGHLLSPYVQFWNEVNGYCYWDRGLDPYFELFAQMHIWAARVAREEHGRKTVLAGIIPAGGPQWIDLMGRYGVLEHTDLVALHGFPGTWLPRRIGWAHLLERVNQVLRRHGKPCPIWICEVSYSTMRQPGRRSLEHEFRQLAMFQKLLGLPVERIFWYTTHDLPLSRRSAVHAHLGKYDLREHGCGLRQCDGTPKMLWNAWAAHDVDGIARGVHLCQPLRELMSRDLNSDFLWPPPELEAAAHVSSHAIHAATLGGGEAVTSATKTTDHETIRRWAEARGGHPASVAATHQEDDAGILRIDFEGTQPEGLERITWNDFFETFERARLAFLHQDLTESGQTSRFFKFVQRD